MVLLHGAHISFIESLAKFSFCLLLLQRSSMSSFHPSIRPSDDSGRPAAKTNKRKEMKETILHNNIINRLGHTRLSMRGTDWAGSCSCE